MKNVSELSTELGDDGRGFSSSLIWHKIQALESRLTVPTKAIKGVTSTPILSLAKKEVLRSESRERQPCALQQSSAEQQHSGELVLYRARLCPAV